MKLLRGRRRGQSADIDSNAPQLPSEAELKLARATSLPAVQPQSSPPPSPSRRSLSRPWLPRTSNLRKTSSDLHVQDQSGAVVRFETNGSQSELSREHGIETAHENETYTNVDLGAVLEQLADATAVVRLLM